MTTCAGNNTIAALVAGAIDATAARRLELHLDACTACRELVASLGRGLSAIRDDRLPRAGEQLGRYTIQRVIGVGGMGIVYEAHDATLGRRVAVKLLRPERAHDQQLLGEAQIMARLHHPNIAMVHDVGSANGQLYICMEYIAGITLREWLAERRRSWREIAGVFVAAGRGLDYVHREGLVHLDFKPDNVLIDRSGRVVVTDFGIAHMVGAGRAGVITGTPAYMAPEQRRGGATDARTDQFGFCAALREALAADAPAWLRRVLARGLSELRADRFASMRALLAAIEAGMRRVQRGALAAVAIAAVALVGGLAMRAPGTTLVDRPIDRVVERPMLQRVVQPGVAGAAAELGACDVSEDGDDGALAADVSHRGSRIDDEPSVAARRGPYAASDLARDASDRTARADDDPMHSAGDGVCDDGGEQTCAADPPWCPPSTVRAMQDGCWTCADERSCAPLGTPHACEDGSRLQCASAPPACSGRTIATIRGGCWQCADPFECTTQSTSAPVRQPLAMPHCGDAVCEAGETIASCPVDCRSSGDGGGGGGSPSQPTQPGSGGSGPGSGSDDSAAVCGNGFCEAGETHATCPADCCEPAGSGGCTAVCGNGFCEAGEDHASCPADCCALDSSGECEPVCGNGFCESGETHASCPADC